MLTLYSNKLSSSLNVNSKLKWNIRFILPMTEQRRSQHADRLDVISCDIFSEFGSYDNNNNNNDDDNNKKDQGSIVHLIGLTDSLL